MCLSFFKHRQAIKESHDSTIHQAGRDLNIINQGMQYPELRQMVTDMVKSEMFQLYQQAEVTKVERAKEYEQKLVERISEDDRLVGKFQRPDIQFVTRDSLKQFVMSGSEEDLEEQVDMLIDRLKAEEGSVSLSVIEEAINILPKLSKPAVALLAAMRLRDLTMDGTTEDVLANFSSRQGLYKLLSGVRSIDLAYLRQLNCCDTFIDPRTYLPFERLLINKYNMLFRHYGNAEEAKKLMENFHIGDFRINGRPLFSLYKDKGMIPSCHKLSMLELPLKESGKEDLYEKVKTLVNGCPEYTENEVRSFMVSEFPGWEYAFDVLNRKEVQQLIITPLGAYIGQKFLKKTLNMNCPDIDKSF